MFVSFLYPFRLRNRAASYLWVAYKQVTDLAPEDVCFVCSEDYYADPAIYARHGRFECSWPENPELGFRVPDLATLEAYEHHFVPRQIYRRLKERFVADSLVWLHLIREVDEELTEFLLHAIDRIAKAHEVEALLTWCNFASVEEAGRRARIPVIHNELGPLRAPWYNPLGYFDFSGVNGHTEAEQRFRAYVQLPDKAPPLEREKLLNLFAATPLFSHGWEPEFELGIPLQVEDDSNVLAYGRGFDLPLVVQYAQEATDADRILIRPHPGAYYGGQVKRLAADASPTSMDFVRRCRRLLTLNSSVAVEAMLSGVPTTILGESPAGFAAGRSLAAARQATAEDLDFLLLVYFVPYEVVFRSDYFRWRLTGPDEVAIRQRHLEVLRAHRV